MAGGAGQASEITLDPNNANRGTVRGLGMVEHSLSKLGAGRSVLVDKNGVLIAGNKTFERARELGIPVQVIESDGKTLYAIKRTDLDLATDDAARELGIADNRASEVGLDWDDDVLRAFLDEGTDLGDWFFEDELADLLNLEDEPTAGLTDPDAVPEPPAEPITKPGDVWVLGEHRLMCGSATVATDVDRLLQDEVPTFVFADPPYGISIVDTKGWVGGGAAYDIPFGGVKNRKGLGAANGSKPFGSKNVRGSDRASNMVEVGRYEEVIGDDTTETAIDSFTLAYSLAPKAVHVWWGGNYYANALPPSSCWIVWDKENTGNFADAELAWTNQPTAVRIFKHMWNGLMKASERGEKRVHPTQKPVALAEWCFEQYGKADDIVYDPFAGSGISLIAGENLGRRVRAMEMSPAYVDVIVQRWEQYTGQTAHREPAAEAAD